MNNKQLGILCALFAAVFNSMIGIFSVNIMNIGMGPYAVAFYKCLIGLVILTSWLICSKQFLKWLKFIRKFWWQLPITSFFGFFVMYFFETTAYHYEKVTVVVFVLLGTATIISFALSSFFNRSLPNRYDIFSCSCALIGLGLIFGLSDATNSSYQGVGLALLAGVGYGAFIILSKQFNIGSGMIVVNGLMFFGTIYLAVPFVYEGVVGINNLNSLVQLLLLSLLPTIGGFWCTTKAISLLKGETVQLLELSEPVFSLLLSFIFLSQILNLWQLLGGAVIILSIFIHMKAST
ncbi:MAG: DMT family transporter [Burkholderiales bacterium]|nr:DMT family transporter [Burkholderiales bacterium]MBP9768576.1 DMT family transporter [Burkholderiales bacterium]